MPLPSANTPFETYANLGAVSAAIAYRALCLLGRVHRATVRCRMHCTLLIFHDLTSVIDRGVDKPCSERSLIFPSVDKPCSEV